MSLLLLFGGAINGQAAPDDPSFVRLSALFSTDVALRGRVTGTVALTGSYAPAVTLRGQKD